MLDSSVNCEWLKHLGAPDEVHGANLKIYYLGKTLLSRCLSGGVLLQTDPAVSCKVRYRIVVQSRKQRLRQLVLLKETCEINRVPLVSRLVEIAYCC